MLDADDTVTGLPVLALLECSRCGRQLVVYLTGAVCACGMGYGPGDEPDEEDADDE